MQTHPKQTSANTPQPTQFNPHVTVATVIEQNGRFLFVEELSGGKRVINQPAGHLEADETLIEAAVRETLEETGYLVKIKGVLSINLYTSPNNNTTYHRTTFCADVIEKTDAQLDEGIIQAVWLSEKEARGFTSPVRSPLVLDAVRRFQSGQIYPLSLMDTLGDQQPVQLINT